MKRDIQGVYVLFFARAHRAWIGGPRGQSDPVAQQTFIVASHCYTTG